MGLLSGTTGALRGFGSDMGLRESFSGLSSAIGNNAERRKFYEAQKQMAEDPGMLNAKSLQRLSSLAYAADRNDLSDSYQQQATKMAMNDQDNAALLAKARQTAAAKGQTATTANRAMLSTFLDNNPHLTDAQRNTAAGMADANSLAGKTLSMEQLQSAANRNLTQSMDSASMTASRAGVAELNKNPDFVATPEWASQHGVTTPEQLNKINAALGTHRTNVIEPRVRNESYADFNAQLQGADNPVLKQAGQAYLKQQQEAMKPAVFDDFIGSSSAKYANEQYELQQDKAVDGWMSGQENKNVIDGAAVDDPTSVAAINKMLEGIKDPRMKDKMQAEMNSQIELRREQINAERDNEISPQTQELLSVSAASGNDPMAVKLLAEMETLNKTTPDGENTALRQAERNRLIKSMNNHVNTVVVPERRKVALSDASKDLRTTQIMSMMAQADIGYSPFATTIGEIASDPEDPAYEQIESAIRAMVEEDSVTPNIIRTVNQQNINRVLGPVLQQTLGDIADGQDSAIRAEGRAARSGSWTDPNTDINKRITAQWRKDNPGVTSPDGTPLTDVEILDAVAEESKLEAEATPIPRGMPRAKP